MRKTVVTCDLCGAEIPDTGDTQRCIIVVVRDRQWHHVLSIPEIPFEDLCLACYERCVAALKALKDGGPTPAERRVRELEALLHDKGNAFAVSNAPLEARCAWESCLRELRKRAGLEE